jgi:hypothetical protein
MAAAAILAAAVITGCSGHGVSAVPQTPTTHDTSGAPRKISAQTNAGGSLFHPNSVKYSDKGSHPATGRSGSAVVQSRALLAKDGTALVEATTGTLDAQPGPGNIKHVTTQATTVDGTAQPTSAYNGLNGGGYWSHTYTGFARNEKLRVDTNITGIDGNRTDVVTTNDTVKLRPDLKALDVSGPAKAYTNAPVTFTANVREMNGDVGAHADCVLSVDGRQVAQALGIWVDAASTVSCTFQTSFATTGTKHVSVAVSNVVPADWDTSNNTAQTTIEIVDPIVKLTTNAYANAYTFNNGYTYTYSDPWEQYNYSDGENGSVLNASIDAYTYTHAFQFPVGQFNATLNADGNPLVAQIGTGFSPVYTNGYGCSYTYGNGFNGGVCSQASGYTYAFARFYETAVTYYDNSVDCGYWGCSGYSYIENEGNQPPGTTFDLGNSDQFVLKFTDAAGTQYDGTTAAAATQPYHYQDGYNDCWSYWDYYYQDGQWCEGWNDTQTGKTVSAYGAGS